VLYLLGLENDNMGWYAMQSYLCHIRVAVLSTEIVNDNSTPFCIDIAEQERAEKRLRSVRAEQPNPKRTARLTQRYEETTVPPAGKKNNPPTSSTAELGRGKRQKIAKKVLDVNPS